MQLSGEKAKMFIEALEQSEVEEAACKKINTRNNCNKSDKAIEFPVKSL